MDETIVVENGQAAVATTAASGTLSPKSSATDIITVVDTPSGKQAAVVTTSVSGTLSPESSVTDTIAVVDTPSGKQAAVKVYNVGGGGGAPSTKFGVSIDNLLGSVDANGDYKARTDLFTVDMTQVKIVTGFRYANLPNGDVGYCYNTFSHKFYYCGNLVGTIDLSNLEETSTTSEISFEYAFASTSVDTVYLPKNPTHVTLEYSFMSSNQLTDVYIQSTDLNSALKLRYTFNGCKKLKNIHGLDKVVSMALYNTFKGTGLDGELHFDSLTTMGASNGAFAETKITKLYFPSLTTFSDSSPFGSSKYTSMIQNCTDLVEMHFRADVQATVEALTGYSSKFWGPSTLAIYFDL